MLAKIIRNLILYSSSFLFSLFLHTGSITLNVKYEKYYSAFLISWAVSSLLSRKFKVHERLSLLGLLYTYTVSFFLMLGILALMIFYFDLAGVSRFIILYSLLLSYLVEVNYIIYKNKDKINFKNINLTYSSKAFTFEVTLYGVINIYLIYSLTGNVSFVFDNIILFINFYLCWFVGSFVGHRFHPAYRRKDYWTFVWQYIKSYIIILALSSFSAFVIRLESDKIIYIVYGLIGYSILSLVGISFYYYIKKHRLLELNFAGFPVKGEFGDILLSDNNYDIKRTYRSSFNITTSEILNDKLKNLTLKKHPEVFQFLDNYLDLNSFDNSHSVVFKSESASNIDFLPENSYQLLLNIQTLNKTHGITQYLNEINKKLMKEGIFVGNFETVYLRHQNFLKRYPYYFAQFFYFFDFLLNRVLSKIIVFNGMYSALMKNTNKSLSLAEGLGRLYYSGFEVLHLRIIENRMFFIEKKIKESTKNGNPSSGLLLRMERFGQEGKPIYLYKLRTMHPYAEYLQEFVYEKFKLQDSGKFNNDFRITYWGKIFRKLWIDELPMIYNWIHGELKLVGPRPLSKHYLSLYRKDLAAKRLKIKPGLIPPYYADLPNSLEEIMDSEEKYLELFEKKPLITDIKYFVKCIYNIFFKNKRSS